MDYLLTHLRRDLHHLLGLLARLDGFALAEQRPVTVPLLKKLLAEEAAPVPGPGAPVLSGAA